MPEVSVIIPFYNEGQSLGELFPKLEEQLKSWDTSVELLMIDDGSTDGLELTPSVEWSKVIRHPINLGNGAAIKTGIRNAKGAKCVILDADGQHQSNDAKRLLDELDSYHLVVGARDFENSGTVHRNLANRFYSKFASFMAASPIKDLTSGIRAFRRKEVMELIHLFPNRFSCPSTMTLGMIKLGYAVKFIPIEVLERTGKSKINLATDGVKFLLIILKIATLFSPLRLFFPISLAMFSIGFLNYIWVFFASDRFSQWSIVLLTNSITIFMIGLVAEEISSLKLKKDPMGPKE